VNSLGLSILDRLLLEARPSLEAAGILIEGRGGNSPEGYYWQYDFILQWALPPDRASIRIFVSWWAGYGTDESVDVSFHRSVEIFRQGQVSSFKRTSESVASLEMLQAKGLGQTVEDAIKEGRAEFPTESIASPASRLADD
jgi:hypothetical protein